MAMKDFSDLTDPLQRRFGRPAGAVSILLGLAGVAGLIIYLVTLPERSTDVLAAIGIWIGVMVLVAAAGAQLMRGRTWAQQLLSFFWAAVLAAAAVEGIATMLWGVPSWWVKLTDVHIAAVLVLLAAASAFAGILAMLASEAGTRLRYGTVVISSVVAAVLVAVVINMIAQAEPWRKDIQTLGRFSLSERTKRILDSVDTPVRLTCVYTSTDEKTPGAEFRPRVIELLEEMRQHNGKLEVINVTSDADKAKVVARLKDQLGGATNKHAAFLDAFAKQGDRIAEALQAQRDSWDALGEDSYLYLWSLPPRVKQLLGDLHRELTDQQGKARAGLAGVGLPDYAKLVNAVKEKLQSLKDLLEQEAKAFERIRQIPQRVAANRAKALADVDGALAGVESVIQLLGSGKGDQLKETLAKFAAEARKASEKAWQAARALDEVAGKQNAPLVRNSRAYLMVTQTKRGAVRIELGELYKQAGKILTARAMQAEGYARKANPQAQAELVVSLRKDAQDVAEMLKTLRGAAGTAMDRLAYVDEPTGKIFQQAAAGKLFEPIIKPAAALLDQAGKLPELDSSTLATDISGENIVIVEAGGKAEVVTFRSVWPPKGAAFGPGDNEAARKRVFNGDSAIASKILSMTHEPFATVLLTHYDPPPEKARTSPSGDIPVAALGELRKRLEEANFEVKEWNLSQDKPQPDDTDASRAEVLLIVPPPVAIPSRQGQQREPFGPDHEKKIREAIDSGTGAIFLTGFTWPRRFTFFMPPVQPPYAFGDYLRDQWGIDVKTDYRIIPAVADETVAGKAKINPIRFFYLPLSNFTDHPIARPLQGQRTVWSDLCPVEAVDNPPKGVEVQPLLAVPANWTGTWASRRVIDLDRKIKTEPGSLVGPDYEAGDMPIPPQGLPVAAAAIRKSQDGSTAASIVVLGMGMSMIDGYLGAPVPRLDARGGMELTDEPSADADVVINSAYWLAGGGLAKYIAAGPVHIKPVKIIAPATRMWLWALCVIGLPVLAAAAGGVVMLVRRR